MFSIVQCIVSCIFVEVVRSHFDLVWWQPLRTCDVTVAAKVMKTLEEKMEFVVGSCIAGCSGSRSYNSDLVATTVVLVSRC